MIKENPWYVYIIETDKGFYYTGITTDIDRRFKEHKSNKKKGARFFRSSKPIKIIYFEKYENRSLATKREIEIKKMTKLQKVLLVNKGS
ncbi:MAG: GIY-YIG nuclease family protein [Bacteriovoracaceae bacterium]